MITRAQITYEIWQRLNKTPQTPGFFTQDKVNTIIQEGLDFLGSEQMLADEGFNKQLEYLPAAAGAVSINIPFDMAMLCEVSYLVGDIYMPLTYDSDFGKPQWAGSSTVQPYPCTYKIINNNLYFNPPIGVGGPKVLQIQFNAYPPRLTKDSSVIPAQFDRAMLWYLVYSSCNSLSGLMQQTVDDWQRQEAKWYQKAIQMIGMRTRQVIAIQDFTG